MGSFNVGCAISNLSIDPGDKIGFMIMGKPKVYLTHYPPKRDRSFYTYANDLYKPFLAPIFGEYGDYGRIENIVPSVTTRLIESIFSKPIEVIMNIVGYDDGVYDDNGGIFEHYFIGDTEDLDMDVEKALLTLGFEHRPASESEPEEFLFSNFSILRHRKDRYTIVDKAVNVELKSSFYCDSKNAKHMLEFFSQVTGVYPGYNPKHFGIINVLQSLTGTFFLKQVYDDMSGVVESERFDNDWAEFMDTLTESTTSAHEFHSAVEYLAAWDYVRRETVFPRQFIRLLVSYKGSKEFSGVYTFMSIMSSVNRMLIPSFCGEQHGNDDASIALNTSTDAILKKRLKDSEEL